MGYLDELLKESEKTVGAKEKTESEKKEEAEKEEIKKVIEETGEKESSELEYLGAKTLVSSYGNVKVYKVEGEPLLVYTVPVIKPKGPEKILVNTIKEAATRLITISPEQIRDPERRRKVYFDKVKEIIEGSPELGVPRTRIDFYADMVVREMIGYGVLDPLVQDDKLEEIMVIGPNKPVYVAHRDYEMMKTNIMFANDDEIKNIIDRIARQVNRRVDLQTPLLDARLPDGSRVNATIKPVSVNGNTLTIRKFREDPYTVVDLVKFGTIDLDLAAFLWLAVDGLGAKPANIIISGGTGSGKTTTLNVLSSFIPPSERVITIEDTAELKLPIEHWVRMETRPPSIEGKGEINMEVLVKNSLRMRPDRIIVGEIRYKEAETLFTAINTGHDGSAGTVHANSAHETVIRVTSPPMNVPEIMLEGLDLVVVQQRIHDRRKGTIRRVTEVAEVTGVMGGKPQIQVIFERDPALDTIKATGIPSRYIQKLMKFTGLSKSDIGMEIDKRKDIIKSMLDRGIRRQDEVVREFRKLENKEWGTRE